MARVPAVAALHDLDFLMSLGGVKSLALATKQERQAPGSGRPLYGHQRTTRCYIILELPSLDVALDWAARCLAAATGAVEIRPLFAM